jgi:hypothetical protein
MQLLKGPFRPGQYLPVLLYALPSASLPCNATDVGRIPALPFTEQRFLQFGGFVLQVDTFTAERYSPHQIKRHNVKVQAPAP